MRWLVLALVACSHAPPPAPPPPPPPPVRACPATYAQAAAGTCSLAEVNRLSCSYPDGHCSCAQDWPCAGWKGAFTEAENHPRAQWGCVPAVRTDGCPGDVPHEGSSCTNPGQECAYNPCGGSVLSCAEGQWKVTGQLSKPG